MCLGAQETGVIGAMGLEQIARNKEVYLGWLKKDQAEEEENKVWCFRSQGK